MAAGKWFAEQIQAFRDNAIREVGKAQGKQEAFEDVINFLNPERYCQDCGQRLYTANDVKSHAEHCPAREERAQAEPTPIEPAKPTRRTI